MAGYEEALWQWGKWVVRSVVWTLAAMHLLSLAVGYAPPAGSVVVRSTGGTRNPPYVETDPLAGYHAVYEVSQVLETTRSNFQSGEVFSTPFFGNVLLLDDEIMLTERDEAHYHEMLAHVPLAYVPDAKRVLIIGGGDGGTLKQVLKHPNVERATMVEIDDMVVRLSKTYFPTVAEGFADPRASVVFADGRQWVMDHIAALESGTSDELFDAVLLDTTDFGNAATLFTSEFYSSLKRVLKPSGVMAFNVDSPAWALHVLQMVALQFSALFQHAAFFQTWQPTYGSGHYSFLVASDTIDPLATPVDWDAFASKEMAGLKYYNPGVHVGSFLLPSFVEAALPWQQSTRWHQQQQQQQQAGACAAA